MKKEMDFEHAWQEYRNELGFTTSVICSKCKTNGETCECSKKLWIDEQKWLKGDKTVEPPFVCYHCKEKMFQRWSERNNDKTVDICVKCLENS